MKKAIRYILGVTLALMSVSCTDFFETESNGLVKVEDDAIDTQRAAFYAMLGILQNVQQVGDRYVILSELRGDLLEVTEQSSQELRDVYQFEVDAANPYHMERDLYALINNCNYLIQTIDTSLVVDQRRVLTYEYAQAKTIRAWAYLQLSNLYGEVYYYTQPVLDAWDVVEADTLNQAALLDVLIQDLTPLLPAAWDEPEQMPDYGNIGSFNSKQLFMPIRFVLGELYLWKQEYSLAAQMYYELIYNQRLTVLNLTNAWNGPTFTNVSTRNWTRIFGNLATYNEMISIIPYTTETSGNATMLPDMFQENYVLRPTPVAIQYWENQTYAYDATVSKPGDLRGAYGSYETKLVSDGLTDAQYSYVTKFKNIENFNILCRSSTVYLRYAEAINRMGAHQMAFAVLKYGLTPEVLNNPLYVPASEYTPDSTGVPYYMEFGQQNLSIDRFTSNIGMHSRGCGTLKFFKSYSIEAGVDTLQWVEDQIVTELALETAFEGGRFTDLMRVAKRRDPLYLANQVSSKFDVGLRSKVFGLLSNPDNWFLPHQE
ncbi:MAG: RagB/SusD family nutrient uptake outer membrane protein [Bacteroidales bacterium]|nr:RagB/SusD family nutrient uptake outer membrane protein [Bacteroidales bacterium]